LQPGDVPDTYADVEALVEDVGYKPDTTIELGIAKFVSWYNSYYTGIWLGNIIQYPENTFDNIIYIGKVSTVFTIVKNLYFFAFLNRFSK
jgi:hypothetical protein